MRYRRPLVNPARINLIRKFISLNEAGETAPSKSSPQNQNEADVGATSKQTTVSQYQFSLGSPSATLNQL